MIPVYNMCVYVRVVCVALRRTHARARTHTSAVDARVLSHLNAHVSKKLCRQNFLR